MIEKILLEIKPNFYYGEQYVHLLADISTNYIEFCLNHGINWQNKMIKWLQLNNFTSTQIVNSIRQLEEKYDL